LHVELLEVSLLISDHRCTGFYFTPSAKGSDLESPTCPKLATGSYDPCYAAFMGLHITPSATGYFEVGFLFRLLRMVFNLVPHRVPGFGSLTMTWTMWAKQRLLCTLVVVFYPSPRVLSG